MSTTTLTQVAPFFEAIEAANADKVRQLLAGDKSLTVSKHRSDFKYDKEVELDAYKFLGAYIGQLTGLQFAILKGHDSIAKDIIDATLVVADLDIQYGGGNTALHLATFLGARDVVKRLLERGADRNIKNAKGFSPIDVLDDEEMRHIYGSV